MFISSSLAFMRIPAVIRRTILPAGRYRGKRLLTVLAAAVPLLTSCERPEGPGGKGLIRGQVIVRCYDRQFRVLQTVYPAADEDVYILYGSSETVSDDRTTSPEGKFEFRYLSRGDYTVYVYSEDSTRRSPSGEVTVTRPVRLSSNSQEVDLGPMIIYRSLEFDEGGALVRGLVRQVNYAKDFAYPVDTTDGRDLDVYLVYEDDPGYTDRIRTLYDGSFAFPGLIRGNFTVFVYSGDPGGSGEKVPVMKNVEVDELQGTFDAGTFYVAGEI